MDRDLHEIYSIPIKILLEKTINKQFFTQDEFEKNYGILMYLASLRNSLENKLKNYETQLERNNKGNNR